MRLGLICLLVAACTPAAPPPAEPPARIIEAPRLDGDWTVVAIGGKPLVQQHAIRANVAAGRFAVNSQCVNFAWTYRHQGAAVDFTPAPVSSCVRASTREEEAARKAIDAATSQAFSDEGRTLLLSGANGTLSLARR
jgi:hypothetical protein